MPRRGTIDAMEAAARASGCEIDEAFSQRAHVNVEGWQHYSGNHGLCAGLAAMWLDMLRKGEGEKFRESVMGAGEDDKPVRNTVHTWWDKQAYRPWVKDGATHGVTDALTKGLSREMALAGVTRGGLIPAMPKSTKHQIWTENFEFKIFPGMLKNDGTTERYEVEGDGIGKLVDKFNGTTGKRRFFLISTGGHAMAAAKNRKGRLRFYDPNGGVVSTWFASNMKKFLTLYLSTEEVFDAYKSNRAGVMSLDVNKYKPSDW